ncbi:unnamed protein product, partial [Candidula unifasciata]
WYFGMLSRDRTNNILMNLDYSGVFLVRESKTMPGDFVLCVKEDQKVSHYIINRIQTSNGTLRFKIGDKEFPDMPSLLNFYKTHYLDTTTLIKPAPRVKLLCKFDFSGKDPEDLPFKKGDILEVIAEDEEEWWTARNSNGQVGLIPVRYTQVIENPVSMNRSPGRAPDYQQPQIQQLPTQQVQIPPSFFDVQLPAKAMVILQRIPSAYDKRQLRLEVGEIITVLKMSLNGQWEGRDMRDREGIFPFTHIRFLTQEELRNLPP